MIPTSVAFGYYPDFLIIGTELTDQGDHYRVACAAMQLFQDRQQHTQHDMLDPHERKVLEML